MLFVTILKLQKTKELHQISHSSIIYIINSSFTFAVAILFRIVEHLDYEYQTSAWQEKPDRQRHY